MSVAVAAMIVGAAAPGCTSSGVALEEILTSEVSDLIEQYGGHASRIRIINQTGSDLVMDFLIDDLPQQVECKAAIGLCDVVLSACPERVEAVQMRLYDSYGQFNGGVNYNGNEDFIFESGEFTCTSVLIFDFDESGGSAYAL